MATLATTQPGEKDFPGSAFTVTNATSDYAMDCDNDLVANVADVLAAVIAELIKKGIVTGTVNTA